MKSPFPGMDPYLEPHWLDVHTKLVTYAADSLNAVLPAELIAPTEERIAVGTDVIDFRHLGPDVRVFQPGRGSAGGGAAAVAVPYTLDVLGDEPIIERFIRILGPDHEQLITVIEFLSPTNKMGSGLDAYVAKRVELLESGVSVMEVDLIRRENWQKLLLPQKCPVQALSTYRVTVRPASRPTRAYLYPIPLRATLPSIPVPLRASDPEVRLDLQSLVEQAYRNGRYGQTLDYTRPTRPSMAMTRHGPTHSWQAARATGPDVKSLTAMPSSPPPHEDHPWPSTPPDS